MALNLIQQENDSLPVARRENLKILAYSPLAARFLTGKYTPERSTIPKGTRFDVMPAHVDVYFCDRNFRRVELLHELARRIGVPALQLAMAWVLRQPGVTTVLVGARSKAHRDGAVRPEGAPFPSRAGYMNLAALPKVHAWCFSLPAVVSMAWHSRQIAGCLGQLQDSAKLAGRQAVIRIVPKPDLQLDRRRLTGHATAIDESFDHVSNLRDMEMDRNRVAVGKNKVEEFAWVLPQQHSECV